VSVQADAITILDTWYSSLPLYQDRLPSRGSISAALFILQRLRTNYELDIASHVAGGEAQIKGLSARSLQTVLAEFGETRPITSVGGRSNRGARGDVAGLLTAMRPLKLDRLAEGKRIDVLKAMQRHIVANYVASIFKAKRVKAKFSDASGTAKLISIILDNARANGKAGAVAEYLVGAKLALKFPGKVRNMRFSTSDIQSGYEGDFQIGRTVFHVTVAPMPELYVKLKGNLERGLRVLLLVPSSQLAGAMQNVEPLADAGVGVDSIELFVARNLDELAEFDGGPNLKSGFRRLLEIYNERVDAVELDKSMLIEIPPNV
jgi:hypothetical protein